MRTDEEILARVEAVKEHDWIGTMRGDLLTRLPFEKVKHLLDDDTTEEDWRPPRRRSRPDPPLRVLRQTPTPRDLRGVRLGLETMGRRPLGQQRR